MTRLFAGLLTLLVCSTAFAAEPAPSGPAESPPDRLAALVAEVEQLRAEVGLLRRENARLQKEVEALRKTASPEAKQAEAAAAEADKTASWWTDLAKFAEDVRVRNALMEAKKDYSLSPARLLAARNGLAGQKVRWTIPGGTVKVWTAAEAEAEWHRVAVGLPDKEDGLANIRQSVEAYQVPAEEATHRVAQAELDLAYAKALVDLYRSLVESGGGTTLEYRSGDLLLMAVPPLDARRAGELFPKISPEKPMIVEGAIVAARVASSGKNAGLALIVQYFPASAAATSP